MIIFVDEEEEKRKEEQIREELRKERADRVAKIWQQILDDRKRGIHKTLEERIEEDYYNSLGVEDQFFYGEERRVRKFLESIK
ncbi:hypothetical protein [Chitinophaga filiformis]|uniref:Uncharacterized protein n=1 Tax=Chitinophaga filiformis TaxID=104663 RepID=A0A1G7GT47_CHIFI|nr:hypothetical protein [Chitinophaga filiformis]SDE91304.1 hypothetical protein SAMN04488121_101149 [Chitinophaga filiformis]